MLELVGCAGLVLADALGRRDEEGLELQPHWRGRWQDLGGPRQSGPSTTASTARGRPRLYCDKGRRGSESRVVIGLLMLISRLLGRRYFKGHAGNAANATLTAAGYNSSASWPRS